MSSDADNDWNKPLDGSISLLRGIHHKFYEFEKLTSAPFTHLNCSVNRNDLETPENTMNQSSDYVAVASIPCSYPPTIGQKVKHDPKLHNIAHCLIVGKKTKAIKRLLRDASTIVLKK